MKKLILMLLIGLSSCAPQKEYPGEITEKFNYALDQFNNDLQALGHSKINFSGLKIRVAKDIPDMMSGICHKLAKRNYGDTNITLHANLSDKDSVMVLYHEIGHCYFGLGHSNKYGLMTGSGLWGTQMQSNFQYYEKRLEMVKILIEDAGPLTDF